MKHHGGYNDECYASCNSSGNGGNNGNGNSLTRLQLLGKIQELDFAKVETGLYLDAYPDNRAALKYYREVCEHLDALTKSYEMTYGPVTMGDAAHTSTDTWSWTKGPLPWQYEMWEEF